MPPPAARSRPPPPGTDRDGASSLPSPGTQKARRSAGLRSEVELTGALSEPRNLSIWRRGAKRNAALVASGASPAPFRPLRRANGWVWQAIREVLGESEEPMSPAQIHLAVGVKLDQYVSKSTIKNELRRQLGRASSPLRQSESGQYGLVV